MANQKINYDAEFCGKVPLNQTNLIQPHGALLIIDRKEYRIIQVSENIKDITGLEAKEMAGSLLKDHIHADQFVKFKERYEGRNSVKLPFAFSFANGNYLAHIHTHELYFILELDMVKRTPATDDSFINIYQELKYIMAEVERAGSTEEAGNITVQQLKMFSGFDKIMIYKFDEQWNGDVIAEEKEEGMESYLGLKFPASDIPKQARDLYQKTPYRLIPTVNYEPVKLFPVINPITNAFTDLSDTNLRSVAGVHLEYLKNMKVVASMSTRILVNGVLWGLISCHHRSAKYLSFEMCSMFEMLSSVISAKIAALQNQDLFAYKTRMQQAYVRLMEDFHRDNSIYASFHNNSRGLLELLSADGAALVLNNQIETIGEVPSIDDITDLIYWLQSSNINKLYYKSSLSEVYEPARNYVKNASGILVLPIQPDKGSFILAFRPEAVQKVNWGGNPNQAIQFEPDGKKYHPRNSFRLWQQNVEHSAIPWIKEELEVAEQFRSFVVDYTLNKIYN